MAPLIPKQWIQAVCEEYDTYPDDVLYTQYLEKRFSAEFPNSSLLDFVDHMIDYLRTNHARGCEVKMKPPGSTTYEFLFLFEGVPCYGKIMIYPNGTLEIISGHEADKAKLSCE